MLTSKRIPSKRVRALASVYFLRQPPKVERTTPATVTPIHVEAPEAFPANHNWLYVCACGHHSITRVSRLPASVATKSACPHCSSPMSAATLTWIGTGKQPK